MRGIVHLIGCVPVKFGTTACTNTETCLKPIERELGSLLQIWRLYHRTVAAAALIGRMLICAISLMHCHNAHQHATGQRLQVSGSELKLNPSISVIEMRSIHVEMLYNRTVCSSAPAEQ